MENFNSASPVSNVPKSSKSSKTVLVWLVAIIIIAGGIYFALPWYQKYTAIKSVPSYFIENSGGDTQVIKAEKAQDMELLQNETLESNAISYVENKSRAEVMQDFYKKITDNKWMVIGGTTEESNRSVFKMTDGKTLMFITLEGKQYEPPTTVKIFKVLKSN